MFFILSKTISFVAMPLTLISIFWIMFLVWPKGGKWKKRWMFTALILSFVFTNNFLAYKLMYWWEIPVTPLSEINQRYEVGVVLTGVALTDRAINDRVYFARGADRIVHAHLLYQKGIIKNILITGGTGRIDDDGKYPEAEALKRFLLQVGVPEQDIIVEPIANNTYENALFTAEILNRDFPGEKVLLITSAFHMRRSIGCFRKQGLEFDTFSADFYSKGREKYGVGDYLLPNPDALQLWTKLFKEWIGLAAYKVAGYI